MPALQLLSACDILVVRSTEKRQRARQSVPSLENGKIPDL